jgi:hypothetical protein
MRIPEQLPEMVDAVFSGIREFPDTQEDLGWVSVAANAKGRAATERVFPGQAQEWGASETGWPADWQQCCVHVASADDHEHRLPLDIVPDGTDWTESNADALAFLLAMAVRRQGARVAQIKDGGVNIIGIPGEAIMT